MPPVLFYQSALGLPYLPRENPDQRLGNLGLLVQDLEANVHRPRGLSWAGFRLLFALWVAGPLEPRGLARLSAVSRASISSVLNTLQRDGLVERRRVSADRRVVTVVLTDRGRGVVADAFREHNRREQAWLEGLTPADRERLTALLRRLLDSRPDLVADPG